MFCSENGFFVKIITFSENSLLHTGIFYDIVYTGIYLSFDFSDKEKSNEN